MFKSKSFDLINEEDIKKREKLYEPKRCRWLNFIVIPALIAFILLMILANVDFTGTAYLTRTTLVTDATTMQFLATTQTSTVEFKSEDMQEPSQLNIISEDKNVAEKMVRASIECMADINNECKMICSGPISNIKTNLENQQRKCAGNSLEVILQSCQFPSSAMKADFLKGNFYLHSLTISSCDLNYIYEQAFNQYSVKSTLQTLIFEHTKFETLDDRRFLGLDVINYFRLENSQPDKLDFLGASFLKPLAGTLNETKLIQYTTTSKKYSPYRWLAGAYFEKLIRVDLSNNYFPDTLENNTFSTLTKVQELILVDCIIRSMESGTFDTIMKTLKYLDLSNNQLTMLSGNFLSFSENNLRIELNANKWDCTCDNIDLIKFIQNSEFDFGEEPRCTTPEYWHGINLKYVLIQCEDIVPTIYPATTTESSSELIPKPTDPQGSTTTQGINDEVDTTTIQIPTTNPINIICRDYTKNNVFNQTIRNYDVLFKVYSESPTSVVLFILNDMSDIRLIYFNPKKTYNTHYSKTGKNTSAKASRSICERGITTTIIHIQGLNKNDTYVFCLVPYNENRISPFNCRSEQLEDPIDFRESWLDISDIAWIVPVIGIGIVACITIGTLIIYWTLRWRPTWLCGSKRLIKMGCKPHEMLLLAKVDYSAENQYKSILENMYYSRSYDSKRFFDSSNLKKIECPTENFPPSDRAPAIPSRSSRSASTQSTIIADGMTQHYDLADLDNDYQSLNHYEHIS